MFFAYFLSKHQLDILLSLYRYQKEVIKPSSILNSDTISSLMTGRSEVNPNKRNRE